MNAQFIYLYAVFVMNNLPYNLVVILGPTASGKTSVAAKLAYEINGEIISADSRQVYREMNLGTGKDYSDYVVNETGMPCHLIDIVDPGYKYNVFEYQQDFIKVFNDILLRGKVPVLCGGSGLYIEAIIREYRMLQAPVNMKLRKRLAKASLEDLKAILETFKSLHNKTDIDTKKRAIRAIEIAEFQSEDSQNKINFPELNYILFGIRYDRETTCKRIYERLQKRLSDGMVDEVKNLLERGISTENLIYYGLEYKFINLYLLGRMPYEEMVEKLNIAIRQYAKRQMTWFRRMERQGLKINWIEGELSAEAKIEQMKSLIFG